MEAALGFTDSDAFALSMLVAILLSFGVVGTLLFCMLRSASQRDREVDLLLDEIEAEEKAGSEIKAAVVGEKGEAWEKEGDWWKAS